jgi:hypothetical protein
MPKLILNAVALDVPQRSIVSVGSQAYGAEELNSLRDKHRGRYLVKRGGEKNDRILSVPLAGELPPLSSTTDHDLSTSPWLLAPLAIEALTRFFKSLDRHLLRWRPLRVLSERPRNLFPAESGLPAWMQRRVVFDFETRIVRDQDRSSTVVLPIRRPVLVFDPSGTHTDTWNERGVEKNGPYDQRNFTPKQLRIAVICQAQFEGQVEKFVAKFLDGMPDVKVRAGDKERQPFGKGFIRRFALEAPKVRTFVASGNSVEKYSDACRRSVEAATNEGFEWNLALVQIDKDFRELPGRDNPYYVVKAIFLKHRVPVQEITLETMRLPDSQLVYAVNNMSLATYAKVGGVPWLLKSDPTVAHELVVGLGSHCIRSSRLGSGERFVGITTVFSSDGRYLLDDRTSAVPYDEYAHALFKSLERCIDSVRKIDNWRSSDAVRLIFHVFKPFRDREVEAVSKLVDALGLTEVKYAFLHVVDDHPFYLFDEMSRGFGYGENHRGELAPERGLAVALGDSECLLCFTGGREVKLPRHGMPQPALLRLHRQSTFRDMTYLVRQAFDFSCHSWRMFTPAPLPITIHYSELIAGLLAGLRDVPNWDPDAMLGAISRTRWFL